MDVDSSDERAESGDKTAAFTVLLHGALKVEQMVALVQLGYAPVYCLVNGGGLAQLVTSLVASTKLINAWHG